jgi:muconate cycloisomerase
MRIESIELRFVRIPFRRPFQHAGKNRTEAETVIVMLRSEGGATGLGEIVPRPYLTGETIEAVLDDAGPRRAARLRGARFASREEVLAFLRRELEEEGRDLATLGGFEIALLDVTSQELGFSLPDVLGGARGKDLPPGAVIGFDVASPELKKHCAWLRLSGKKHIKIKIGRPDDLDRLRLFSEVFGKDARLALDANGAWAVPEAIARLLAIRERFVVDWVEQPVARNDLAGMRCVREQTGLRVMADESLCSLDDGRRLIEARAADIFSIRLGKCGGFLGSLRLVELARRSGIGLHLGSLVGETAILSRAAEIFGQRVSGFACLEGKGQNSFLLQGDIAVDAPDAGGLRLELRRDWLDRFESNPPTPGALAPVVCKENTAS